MELSVNNEINYIELVSSNSNLYSFKFREFIEVQKAIADKYKGKLSNNTNMEIIDKYLLQILEEVWEAKNASDETDFTDELMDSIMYIGSMYSVFNDMAELSIDDVPEKVYFSTSMVGSSLETISDQLISIRRLYPERKWHKNENCEIQKDERFKVSQSILQTILIDFLSVVMHSIVVESVNTYLNYKQRFILNL